MKTVAENLKPPFVAAILLDIDEQPTRKDTSPSDVMVSLAPRQDGFLGLETTHDDGGRWIAVSYWQDVSSFQKWHDAGARRIAETHGVDLQSVCDFRVSDIKQPLYSKQPLTAGERPVRISERRAGIGAMMFSAFPAIAEFLGYEHIR